MANISVDTGAVRSATSSFASRAVVASAAVSAVNRAASVSGPLLAVAGSLSSRLSSTRSELEHIQSSCSRLVRTVDSMCAEYEKAEKGNIKTAASHKVRIEPSAKATLVHGAKESSSERSSDAPQTTLDALYEKIKSHQDKYAPNSFILNILKSYVAEFQEKAEDVDNVYDMYKDPGKGDNIDEGVNSSYSLVADIFDWPSFIPDAFDRDEERTKKAQDWTEEVAKKYGVVWGVAAIIPAALWAVGDFLLAEVPRCFEYVVKRTFKPVEKAADIVWRGLTGEKMPEMVDVLQGRTDGGMSKVFSRLLRPAYELFGGGGGGSR